MAIPSVFTAIDYEGRNLVDGGIVRNFPVRDVKEMGADLVIGSNVATALMPSNKVLNAFQILLQVAFFREAEDQRNEIPLCTIYIPNPLDKYNMGSFNQSDEIMKSGLEEGRKLYPRLKALADSLDAIYGKQQVVINRLPKTNYGIISSFEIKGLNYTSTDFFINTMDFNLNRHYSEQALSDMVRKAYGTRYYSRIFYSLIPLEDGTNKIVFDITENALTFAKLGIHYNEFSGINVIANITSRNFFIPGSRDLLTINIGQNARIRAEHLQYLGRLKRFSLILGTQFDHYEIGTFNNYKEDGVFAQQNFNLETRAQFSTNRNLTIGIGTRLQWMRFDPSISSHLELKGQNKLINSFVYFLHNSLDRTVYPKRGIKIDARAELIYNQDPDLIFSYNGQNVKNLDSAGFMFSPYQRAIFNIESYTPITNRIVVILQGQSGMNFRYGQRIMNEFSIGGLTQQFPNQVTFAGLKENTFYSSRVACFQLGLRYQILNNTYVIGKSNVLFNNFISKNSLASSPDFLSGYALTFAYNFALGPLELSAMYCDQSKKFKTYVNIGIPF